MNYVGEVDEDLLACGVGKGTDIKNDNWTYEGTWLHNHMHGLSMWISNPLTIDTLYFSCQQKCQSWKGSL